MVLFHNKYSCRALADWVFNNDESVNYILNNKAPKKSTISSFLQESRVLIDAFFQYIVSFGMKVNLIDGECVAVDGTIVKANASNFRLIRIEEIEFLEGSYFNLMVQIGLKNNGVWWNVKSIFFQ